MEDATGEQHAGVVAASNPINQRHSIWSAIKRIFREKEKSSRIYKGQVLYSREALASGENHRERFGESLAKKRDFSSPPPFSSPAGTSSFALERNERVSLCQLVRFPVSTAFRTATPACRLCAHTHTRFQERIHFSLGCVTLVPANNNAGNDFVNENEREEEKENRSPHAVWLQTVTTLELFSMREKKPRGYIGGSRSSEQQHLSKVSKTFVH